MNIIADQLLSHHDFVKFARETFHHVELNVEPVTFKHLLISYPDSGVLQIEPENPAGKDIIISSGIHGNETAPIEICNLLIADILKGSLTVNNRILFIIGNIPAMDKGLRFEVENMNRLFCGKHKGKTHREAIKAARLESLCRQFFDAGNTAHRTHFDLHTAIRDSKFEKFAIYPFQDGRTWDKEYIQLLYECDIKTILLAHKAAATFSYFTSHEFKSNSFTVELGKVRPFGENDMGSFSEILRVLRGLINNSYLATQPLEITELNLFKVIDEVFRNTDSDFSLNIDSKIANFTRFPVGFQLTTDDNNSYRMKSEQHAIVFPNADVPVGQRVALIVEKTTL